MGRTTLLQASLAVERGYDREAFLRVLSRKAGLGEDGWKRGGPTFRRAATIWYLRPMITDPKRR
jgi:AMMECR1 domain-containing protein